MKKGINAYKKQSTEAAIAYADPHKLIDMLLTAGIDNIAKAVGHIDRNEISEKGERLTKAFDIVSALKQSLADEDNEIRNNLANLYEFCIESVLSGNLDSDVAKLNSAIEILKSIREGWRGIPQDLRGKKSDGVITPSFTESYRDGKRKERSDDD